MNAVAAAAASPRAARAAGGALPRPAAPPGGLTEPPLGLTEQQHCQILEASCARRSSRKMLCCLSTSPFVLSTVGEGHSAPNHGALCPAVVKDTVLAQQEKRLSAESPGQQQRVQEPKPAGDTRDVNDHGHKRDVAWPLAISLYPASTFQHPKAFSPLPGKELLTLPVHHTAVSSPACLCTVPHERWSGGQASAKQCCSGCRG